MIGGAQQARASERLRGVEDAALEVEQLGVRLAALDEPRAAVVGERGARHADERSEILGAKLQFVVERELEVGGEPQVEEEARPRQHDGHRERERCGHARADGQAGHGAWSARSR